MRCEPSGSAFEIALDFVDYTPSGAGYSDQRSGGKPHPTAVALHPQIGRINTPVFIHSDFAAIADDTQVAQVVDRLRKSSTPDDDIDLRLGSRWPHNTHLNEMHEWPYRVQHAAFASFLYGARYNAGQLPTVA